MLRRIRTRCAYLPLLVLAGLAACAGSKEMLQPIRGQGPAGIDLSGVWIMQDDFEAMARRVDRAVQQTDGVDERDILRGIVTLDPERRRRPQRKVGGLVHVFLENARRLRITQTDTALFIAFDRSVVEEYRFGEARMARTGGAVAQRVSGWQDGGYVIETLGEDGMKLTERYRPAESGARLTREIVLRSAEMESVSIVQSFARN